MSDVVEFPNPNAFYSYLENLRKAYDEGRLKNFICIYSCDYEEEEHRPKEFIEKIEPYWFGEKSCVYLLGLTDIMKDEIREFMKRKVQEAWDSEVEE